MPKNVRNSWVDLQIDGRSSIGTGPARSDGTMRASFYVRDKGSVVESVTVRTYAYGGNLTLEMRDPDGNVIFEQHTER